MSYKYLDLTGLSHFWDKIKAKIPTKTSQLTNDSHFSYSIEKPSGTIDDLAVFTSGKPGITGSISLVKKSSGVGSEIPAGWYNFYFSPHRTGSGGDNMNYGTIILTPMTFSGKSWLLRRSLSATTISEVKSIATGDIPTKVSQLTNDSGYTTNTGTVTSVAVKMNNTTKGTVTTSGTIDLGTVITAHQDISGKQDKLTAGSNIQIANNTISATDTKYTAGTGISISSSNVISATSSGGVTFDDVYPVGSIYMSVNNTNPSTLFGGTWEQLKDRFLLGAGDTYTAGNTGGEATHKLTKAELPAYDLYNASHSHSITSTSGYNGKQGNNPSLNGGNNQGSGSISVSATIKVSSGGSNQAHNNMPPYLVVYMWKRTA